MKVEAIRSYMWLYPRLTLGELVMHLKAEATVAEIFKAMCWLKLDESIRKQVICGYIGPTNAHTLSRLVKDRQGKLLREAIYMNSDEFSESVMLEQLMLKHEKKISKISKAKI